MNNLEKEIGLEASRRRTFAIISHPDAGKTTLTEKLLLYGGALELAGSVTAKKKQRETASDWMELEKKRGISISSTVLVFEYDGFRMNLLDTPGHKDFSEDTYRVLMAVDAVIMVIDAGKGIESQTRKLFEICKKRGIPIFTFMNKLDRPAKSPIDLIDELESVLKMHAFPVNWPLGNGPEFKGVYDRLKKEVSLFERVPGGAYRAPVSIHDISDPTVKDIMYERTYNEIVEELAILDGAHGGFDPKAVLNGTTTPVFFGSATNNFGVEMLLKGFLKYSTGPSPRKAKTGVVELTNKEFSGFVFKVQTNMNPLHRDRMVFVRICSGKFERDMMVHHSRLKKEIRLSSSHNVFGRDRESVDVAYPGDILGFVTRADFRVGDTISTDKNIVFEEIPKFAPECFAMVRSTSSDSYKSFRKGMDHLLAEDIVQAFTLKDNLSGLPVLGAVGPLQFEVMQYRLQNEYKAECQLEPLPWKILRWMDIPIDSPEIKQVISGETSFGADKEGRPVVLFQSDWPYKYFLGKNPGVKLFDSPEKIGTDRSDSPYG
jgi:peptide chain release factor 3